MHISAVLCDCVPMLHTSQSNLYFGLLLFYVECNVRFKLSLFFKHPFFFCVLSCLTVPLLVDSVHKKKTPMIDALNMLQTNQRSHYLDFSF